MSKDKKDLKSIAILLYVFAILDILQAILLFYMGISGNNFGIAELAKADPTILNASLIACAIIAIIEGYLEYYLGSKAMGEIKGTYTGTAHLKLAAILGALNIVGCVMSAYGLTQGTSTWFELINEVLVTILLLCYRNYCKKVKASN